MYNCHLCYKVAVPLLVNVCSLCISHITSHILYYLIRTFSLYDEMYQIEFTIIIVTIGAMNI